MQEVIEILKGGPGSGSWESPGNPRFQHQGSKVNENHANNIKGNIQGILNTHFPSEKYNVDVEVKSEEQRTRITAEVKSKKGGIAMMSTINKDMQEVVHDDFFLDNESFKKKGLSTSFQNYVENMALKQGCTKAVLQASSEGRYVWPKLGFKCASRKEFLNIKAFANTKGIEINNEKDFYKLKKYFDEGKGIMGEDIIMKKKLGEIKKKSLDELIVFKTADADICPFCGQKLVNSKIGTWCINPDCEVLDEADNY